MKLTFEIRLSSDYHIAAGFGIGEGVDSALQRDADGWPVIRGTAVAGLLRDGLRRLLQTTADLRAQFSGHLQLEQQRGDPVTTYCTEPASACPLCRILGTPAWPKPWSLSSARPLEAPFPVLEPTRLGGQAVTRVRVDPRIRRAKDRHLFSQEEGSRALVFRFTAEADGAAAETRRDAALLVAAARMVRGLGSARRRGRGACLWSLVDSDCDWPGSPAGADGNLTGRALEDFARWWLQGEVVEQSPAEDSVTDLTGESGGGPLRLRVLVRSDEPVLVAEHPEAGNLFRSQGRIGGSTLWGALASRMARRLGLDPQGKGSADETAESLFTDLFFGGGLRVTPLYPAEAASGRSLWTRFPAPLDLLTCKHVPGFPEAERQPGHFAKACAAADRVADECPECGGPLEPTGGLLTLRPPARLEPAEPGMQEEMHPRIDPTTGQVNRGDLFGFRALAAGQFFVGELWLRDRAACSALGAGAGIEVPGADGDEPPDRRPDQLRFGKATRRGYGAASLWLEPLDDAEPPFCAARPIEERVPVVENSASSLSITLTLVSDAILLDPWGRAYGSLEEQRLIDELFADLPCTIAPIAHAYCRPALVDGFAAHLGLPRWRDRAIAAGSAVGLRVVPQPGVGGDWRRALRARLAEIERDGIGVRRAEGFGRVVFNHPIYSALAGVQIRAVDIPAPMRSAPRSGGPLEDRDRLLQRWAQTLDIDTKLPAKQVRGELWRGLARWLNAYAERGFDAIRDDGGDGGLLAKFGADDLLHAKRTDKSNRFEKRDEKIVRDLLDQGVKLARTLLGEERAEAGDYQPELIRMLAGRIAALAADQDTGGEKP